jgi:hypothetical protein
MFGEMKDQTHLIAVVWFTPHIVQLDLLGQIGIDLTLHYFGLLQSE